MVEAYQKWKIPLLCHHKKIKMQQLDVEVSTPANDSDLQLAIPDQTAVHLQCPGVQDCPSTALTSSFGSGGTAHLSAALLEHCVLHFLLTEGCNLQT